MMKQYTEPNWIKLEWPKPHTRDLYLQADAFDELATDYDLPPFMHKVNYPVAPVRYKGDDGSEWYRSILITMRKSGSRTPDRKMILEDLRLRNPECIILIKEILWWQTHPDPLFVMHTPIYNLPDDMHVDHRPVIRCACIKPF